MKIGSFLDSSLSKNVKYSYHHRGIDTPFKPKFIKEEMDLDVYTAETGNLFYGDRIGWDPGDLNLQSVDIKFDIDGKSFVDHIDIHQGSFKGSESVIESVEILTIVDGEYKTIGNFKAQTGNKITDMFFTVPVGYYCDNVVVRLEGYAQFVIIEKIDIWGAWDFDNDIYPLPNNIEECNDKIKLADLKTIKAANDDEKFAAEYFAEKLEELTGHKINIVEANGDIDLSVCGTTEKDSFALKVTKNGCAATAPNRRCLLYAMDALIQLIDGDNVRCCSIEDEAFAEMRGFHVALPARNQIPFLKNIIKYVLVPLRYNMVFVQVSAAMRYDNFPEINEAWLHAIEMYEKGEWPGPAHYGFVGGDILEKAEVRELCDYMESFGLEVIPEVQSYSHSHYITMAYPEMGEKVAVVKDNKNINETVEDAMPSTFYNPTLCPLHEDYYKVIFGVIDEVVDVFKPKRYVHMGHDEILDVGKCSKCKEVPRGELLANEINALYDYLKSKNLGMVIWSDMFQHMEFMDEIYSAPKAVKKIPKDIVMLDFVWYFHTDKDIEDNLLKHGFKVGVGNLYSSYYPRYETRLRKKGMIGGQVSIWLPCNEESYGYNGKFYELIYTAGMLWNGDYDSKFRLTYNELVKPIINDMRVRLGNLKCDGVEKAIDIGGEGKNIPYDIRDIVSYKGALKVGPNCTEKSIDINDYAEIITFIHSTESDSFKRSWGQSVKIGEYVFTYEDGSTATENIMYGSNIYSYKRGYGDPLSINTFRHLGYAGTYFAVPECGKTHAGEHYTLDKYSMRNPNPDKKIKNIKFAYSEGTDTKIILFGINIK